MSGHTNNNNLEIFANKAAPIQLSWAAFLASTGIKEIDYIIGDPHVTPLDSKEYFAEKILNLNNIWCCLSTSNIPDIDTVDTPAINPPDVIVTADPMIADVDVVTPVTLIPPEVIVTAEPTIADESVETPLMLS